ncbi:flagellar basal body P-ring formation chaperone FlgA [Desulfovibrio inopinatus]|uniref:flagellar basal body P-ring formation chaperone FlgA n=1 Tax=Desulfovibrio inopinatus TaxID=102109 RepID=UPI000400DD21|nr:flagellar basal body P-ring formation chaperone FlgA [Desulfovibrio inopinatus]
MRACTLITALTILTALVSLAAPRASAAQAFPIQIAQAACVLGDTVHLGEIAAPAGQFDANEWNRLAGLRLWAAPAVHGQQLILSRAQLREMICQALDNSAADLRLPNSLTIRRGGRVIGRNEIQRSIVEFLTPSLQKLDGEIELSQMNTPDFFFLDDPGDSLAVSQVSDINPGRVTVRVTSRTVDGRDINKINVSFHIAQWKQVPVAKRPLRAGEGIDPATMIAFARQDVSKLDGKPWDGKGGPWRVNRTVGAGGVIYAQNIEHKPLIARGDKVDIIFQGQHIRLATRGVAQSDAALGATILVMNLDSQRQISGVVSDNGVVTVQ